MIYVLQNMLYCLLFIVMVKIGVGNNALNGLYFYPKAVRAQLGELRFRALHKCVRFFCF